MDAVADTETQETDSPAGQAPNHIPKPSIPAHRSIDRGDQSDPSGMGELLCNGALEFIRDWVEKKIRSHLARACQRRGFGWKRWSREWLYGTLGLFNQYHVSYRPSPTAV